MAQPYERLSSIQREKMENAARKYYSTKQYSMAMSFFQSLVRDDPTIPALDFLAASYEKQDQLDNALNTSVDMMKRYKTVDRGYLRCAAILHKMEKTERALKVYETGIKRCKDAGSSVEALTAAHAKLKGTIVLKNATDFVSAQKVPLEVMEMIFEALPFASRCKCMRVSKLWREALVSNHIYWRDLNFAFAKKTVPTKTLENYASFGRGKTRSMYLYRYALQGNRAFSRSIIKCPELETLSIGSGGMLDQTLVRAVRFTKNLKSFTAGLDVSIPYSALRSILNACHHLEQARFAEVQIPDILWGVEPWLPEGYKSLREFQATLVCPIDMASEDVCGYLPTAPNLRKLTIAARYTSQVMILAPLLALPDDRYPQLEELSLKHMVVPKYYSNGRVLFMPFPSTVKRLTLHNCWPLPREDGAFVDAHIANFCANLEDLTCTYENHPDNSWSCTDLTQGLANTAALTRLNLRLDVHCTATSLKELLSLPALKSLRQLQLRIPSGDAFAQIAVAAVVEFKDLESLSMIRSSISGADVKQLVTSCPKLGHVDIRDCTNVSSDALQWARSQGLIVNFSSTFV